MNDNPSPFPKNLKANSLAQTTGPMTTDQARRTVEAINNGMVRVRELILQLYTREGWKALGYTTWRDCVKAEFDQSQSRLYQQLAAAQIEARIFASDDSTMVENREPIPERQLRPLAKIEPNYQKLGYDLATNTAPDGKLTAAHVQSVVDVLKEVIATGAIDPGDGEQIPLSEMLHARITEETYERMKRQDAHIQESNKRKDTASGEKVSFVSKGRAEVYNLPNAIDRALLDLDPQTTYEWRLYKVEKLP